MILGGTSISRRLPFEKMQGVGNDFVVLAERDVDALDLPKLARVMCDRHFGVGADGLLILCASHRAGYRMRMFNPDGSEDDCGNGLRCIVRYIRLHHSTDSRFVVETKCGVHEAEILEHEPERSIIRVMMGEPRFSPAEIPVCIDAPEVVSYLLPIGERERRFTCVNTGSAHAVTFVDALPEDESFLAESRRVETHPIFPERTSVIWAKAQDLHRLKIRIWERGAGETLGCGTGACAAAVAAILEGYGEGPITVESPGGALDIDWRRGEPIRMSGPAATVFSGEWPLP